MKKNIVLIASLCTPFVQAMEKENKWSITAYGTTINLHKTDILEYYADDTKKEDVVVCVGQYKQEELGEVPCGGNPVGMCLWSVQVRFTPKEDSIYYQKGRSKCWNLSVREGMRFLVVTEPRIYFCSETAQYWYDDCECYTKEEAVKESCKDLLLCYNNLLRKGIKGLKGASSKSIALPMLAASFKDENTCMLKSDAIPIAVNVVLEFLKNNPKSYDIVEFFVDDAGFMLYQELLRKAKNIEQNTLLLYFARKDFDNIFSLLPRELIHYIAKLI